MIKMNMTEIHGKSRDHVISNKRRLKSLLFISSFLTYGLGDGISAVLYEGKNRPA
jgi:hypothetical protein